MPLICLAATTVGAAVQHNRRIRVGRFRGYRSGQGRQYVKRVLGRDVFERLLTLVPMGRTRDKTMRTPSRMARYMTCQAESLLVQLFFGGVHRQYLTLQCMHTVENGTVVLRHRMEFVFNP